MFIPNSAKIKKNHKPRAHGIETVCHEIQFGVHGFKSLEPCLLTSKHYEMMRATIAKVIKKTGRFWFRNFPSHLRVQKANGSRMGSGKAGNRDFVAIIKAGAILVELDIACTDSDIEKIHRTLRAKLPCKIVLVKRKFF